MRSGSVRPSATIPYFGSGSVIECPPATATPAFVATSIPPCSTWPSISSGRSSLGQFTMFRARKGVPPIAYTSESAFVAAILPQSYGASTIGVKKSSVAISPCPSGSRTTAASSPVSFPTRTSSENDGMASIDNTFDSCSGPSLQPQPAPWLKLVSLRCSRTRRGYAALMRTAVVGHTEWVEFAHVSRVPTAGEIEHSTDWWEEPAGGGAVAAVQLHKLSGDCTFYTALGRDGTGKRAHLELESLGPRVEVALRRQPTRRAVTFIDGTGERTITTLGERLHPEVGDALPWDDLSLTDAVYFTAGDAAALAAARRAKVLVATSRVLEFLGEADVRLDAVVGSARDPSERYDPRELRHRPGLVVLTDGPRGGAYASSDGTKGRFEPVPPPGPVVDTYGGGDSFAAGLTYALGAGFDVARALGLAATCGAWCVAGRGPYGNQLTAEQLRPLR